MKLYFYGTEKSIRKMLENLDCEILSKRHVESGLRQSVVKLGKKDVVYVTDRPDDQTNEVCFIYNFSKK